MQIAVRCVPWYNTNAAKNFALQTLQFQAVRREFPRGADIGQYRPNQCFVEG
jgi:hypothetical protein